MAKKTITTRSKRQNKKNGMEIDESMEAQLEVNEHSTVVDSEKIELTDNLKKEIPEEAILNGDDDYEDTNETQETEDVLGNQIQMVLDASLDDGSRAMRLQAARERQKRRRQQESQDQRAIRLRINRERVAKYRENETPEQRENRLKHQRVRIAFKRFEESPEQRQKRLEENRIRIAKRRQFLAAELRKDGTSNATSRSSKRSKPNTEMVLNEIQDISEFSEIPMENVNVDASDDESSEGEDGIELVTSTTAS